MHQQALVHDMHQILSGWILFALAIVLAGILALAMFVHALRSNPSERAHGWLVSGTAAMVTRDEQKSQPRAQRGQRIRLYVDIYHDIQACSPAASD